MRKQEKAIVWPVYFDQTRTRKEGRRVSRNLSVPHPKIEEIQEASKKLGLKAEVVVDTSFPKTPWQKTGMIKVEKRMAKEQIVGNIARRLVKMRSAIASVPVKK